MMSPRYSLRAAEKLTGVNRFTLRRWLTESGYSIPGVKRGSKILLSETALRFLLDQHSPQRRIA